MLREPRPTKAVAEARPSDTKGRFRLVKLEERIAPLGKSIPRIRYPISFGPLPRGHFAPGIAVGA